MEQIMGFGEHLLRRGEGMGVGEGLVIVGEEEGTWLLEIREVLMEVGK